MVGGDGWFIRFALALALVSAPAPTASAHSLTDVESALVSKEKFFQPMNAAAPDFALRDADGRTVTLAEFRSKVVILHFIYTNCPDVCPLHAERIAEIQRMVNPTPMKEQVQFVTITTDPKRDNSEVLRDYGQAHGLDPANWVFLTAGPDQEDDTTRRLAEKHGLKFTKTDDGYQMHAVVTHVIDQDGRLRARFHGLKFEPVNLVLFVNALVNRTQRPHGHGEQRLWNRMKGLFR
jgi:protein SCO1/2